MNNNDTQNSQGLKSRITLLAVGLCIMSSFTGCSKQKRKDPKDMSFIEIKKDILTSFDKGHTDDAVYGLEQIVTHHADNPNIGMYKLLLADKYFDKKIYPKAFELYSNFHRLYPANKKAEYSMYKATLSRYYQTLHIDCDTTEIEQTQNLCKFYLDKPAYNTYRKDVTDIAYTCEKKLIDKEVYVYDFYLKQKKFKSAENRLKHLKEKFLPKDPELEPRLLFLECKLAQRSKNKDEALEKASLLSDKFEGSLFTKMAQGLVSEQSFSF